MDQNQYMNVSNLGERFWLLILFEAALGNEFKQCNWGISHIRSISELVSQRSAINQQISEYTTLEE